MVKGDIIQLYKEKSEQAGLQPHDAFIQYLEETYDENDSIDIVIHGNHKYMFTDRITDDHLIVICATLERYAIHIVRSTCATTPSRTWARAPSAT